jgi:hypothetical protein
MNLSILLKRPSVPLGLADVAMTAAQVDRLMRFDLLRMQSLVNVAYSMQCSRPTARMILRYARLFRGVVKEWVGAGIPAEKIAAHFDVPIETITHFLISDTHSAPP